MNLENTIKEASKKLKNHNISSHALDAQIILADIMGLKREFLITNDKIVVSEVIKEKYNIAINRRINNEPVAYITGKKEFWSEDFLVKPDGMDLGLGGSNNMMGGGIIEIPNFGEGAFNLHKMNYSPGATQGVSMHSSGPGGPFSRVPRHSINMAMANQGRTMHSGGPGYGNASPIVVQNTDQSQTVQNSQALIMGGSVADADDLLEASDWLRWA